MVEKEKVNYEGHFWHGAMLQLIFWDTRRTLCSCFIVLFLFWFLVQFHRSVLRAQGVRGGLSLQTPGSGASIGVTLRDATKYTQKVPT